MAAQGAFARISKLAEEAVSALLRENKSVSATESCTGGLIASLLTDVEGASEVFPGGFVTYSNAAKRTVGTDAEVISAEGVYSAACAEAMARAAMRAFGTDFAVGVTGTLGRIDPANADSLPGEVFFCILRRSDVSISAQRQQEKSLPLEGKVAAKPTDEGSPAAAEAAVTERLELDPSLPRPEAKLVVAEAVFTRLLALL